jgi:GH18 family chitinase
MLTPRQEQVQLKVHKEMKSNELKEKRDEIIFSAMNNVQVNSARSREDVQGAIDYFTDLNIGGFISWTMADNTVSNLDLAALQAVKDGYAYRKAQTFAQWQDLIVRVANATTLVEVTGINYVP